MRRTLPSGILPTALLVIALALLGMLLAAGTQELQVFLVVTAAILVWAIWFIPSAVRKEPSVSVALLTTALVVKLLGTLARFLILHFVYEGGDALQYHKVGLELYESVRELDFSFVEPPYLGTSFVDNFTSVLYAITGPSMAGAFMVFSMLAFWGTWLLYRAHRIAFPDGDSKLYFLLLFFIPTMVFWPSSLGKDALILWGLGMGAFGLAQLMQRVSPRALAWLGAGVAVTFAVRPPIGAVLLFAAAVGFLIRPGNLRSPLDRPITWVLAGPVLAVAFVVTMSVAFQYEEVDISVGGILEEFQTTTESLEDRGGSTFETSPLTSPLGFVESILTVVFRPFVWEATNPQVALAALETTSMLVIALWRLGPAMRAIKRWRRGMIIAAVVLSVGVIVPLTAVPNFGVLARQRAQFLPFLFMVLTAAKTRRQERREAGRRASPAGRMPQPVGSPSPAPT